MLAMSDAHGRVDGSVPGLADLARVSIEECQDALKCLSEPDFFSRTKEHEGRRIEPTDGGWQILNYLKYRESSSDDLRRIKNREAVKRFRSKRNITVIKGNNGNGLSSQAEALGIEHKQRAENTPKPSPAATDAEIIYSLYPRKQAKRDALKAIEGALKRNSLTTLSEATTAFAEATASWPADRKQFIPHPASWFNAGSYDDDRSTWIYVPKDTTVSWQRKETTDEDHAKGF
jgi:hypothetical protein